MTILTVALEREVLERIVPGASEPFSEADAVGEVEAGSAEILWEEIRQTYESPESVPVTADGEEGEPEPVTVEVVESVPVESTPVESEKPSQKQSPKQQVQK